MVSRISRERRSTAATSRTTTTGATFLVVSLSLGLAACGYRALYSQDGGERLHVALVRPLLSDALSNDEVMSGLRAAFAREGALASGDGYPRVEVEVLRADDVSEGMSATEVTVGNASSPSRLPRARGEEIGITARAWIVRTRGGEHEADTGDIRAFDLVSTQTIASPSSLAGEVMRSDEAWRAVARRVGEHLALRLLGHPVARDESIPTPSP